METKFKDPSHYKPDDIVQFVMKQLMGGERRPTAAVADNLLHVIGYEVFGTYDVQQIFARHASDHDRDHAKHIGFDVYKTVAYYYGEAEALDIVDKMHKKFKGKMVEMRDAARIIKDDEIVTAFARNVLYGNMYSYRGEKDKTPPHGRGLDYTDKTRLPISIGQDEDFAAFVARRTIKPEALLTSVSAYLDDPALKNKMDIFPTLCRKYKEATGVRVSIGYLSHIPKTHFSKLSESVQKKFIAAHLQSNGGQLILPIDQLKAVDDVSTEVTRSFGTANAQRHYLKDRRVLTPRLKK